MAFWVRHFAVPHLRTVAQLVLFQSAIGKDVLDFITTSQQKVAGQLAVTFMVRLLCTHDRQLTEKQRGSEAARLSSRPGWDCTQTALSRTRLRFCRCRNNRVVSGREANLTARTVSSGKPPLTQQVQQCFSSSFGSADPLLLKAQRTIVRLA